MAKHVAMMNGGCIHPVTSIVTALVAGAAAGLTPTVSQAVKDSYEGLKALIKRKYSHVSIDQLEADPASQARRAVVEEDLQEDQCCERPELLQQARASLMLYAHNRQRSPLPLGCI